MKMNKQAQKRKEKDCQNTVNEGAGQKERDLEGERGKYSECVEERWQMEVQKRERRRESEGERYSRREGGREKDKQEGWESEGEIVSV